MAYATKPEARKLSEKGGKYVYTVRNLAGGKARVVGSVYLDQDGKRWCAEMGDLVIPVEQAPHWDARNQSKYNKANFDRKHQAVTALLGRYEEWRLANEATPADARRLAEQAYTGPRDEVERHTQNTLEAMRTTKQAFEKAAAFLGKLVGDAEDEAKKLNPDPLALAAKAQEFTRNALYQLGQIQGIGGNLMSLTDHQMRLLADHAKALRARAALPPERATALDEAAMAAKAAKRLVRKA